MSERLQLAAGRGRERVVLGVRPEHVRVELSAREGWLPTTVYVTEQMGNETLVFLRLGAGKIIARAPADFRAEPETPAWIKLETTGCTSSTPTPATRSAEPPERGSHAHAKSVIKAVSCQLVSLSVRYEPEAIALTSHKSPMHGHPSLTS